MNIAQAGEILNLAQSAFISMDEEGVIIYWNIRAEEMFGLTRDQAIGRVLAETIIPVRYREEHRLGLRRFLESGEGPVLNQRLELAAVDPTGREFPVEVTISALDEDGYHSFHAFIIDISDRQAADRDRQRVLDEVRGALRGTEQRLDVIVDSLADAVTIRGSDDRLTYANRAALARIGLSSVEELRDTDPRLLMDGWEVSGEDGREIAMDDLPSVRVLRGEAPEPLTMRAVNRETGEEQWVALRATAVRDAEGAIEAAVTIIEDVTVAKRAALRMEFLARAGEILASSLDYQQTLRNVAGLAVPQIADWCVVDLLDEEARRESVAVAHMDSAKLEMAERLRDYEPDELDLEQGLGRVWSTGEAIIYNEIPDGLLVQAALDEEHLRLLRAVGMRAVLLVPMKIHGRTIGALTLVNAESGRIFDESDVEFAEQIAARAALAVENARLYSARSEVARTLQNSLLPERLPEIPGWEIAALYRPAGRDSDVGGDFYDLWEIAGEWLVMVGDVTGKGVGAAAVTSLVRHTAWAASEFDSSPAAILARVNAALRRRPALEVCTAVSVRLAGSRGTIASGGHPAVIHVAEDGVRELGRPGSLLGAFESPGWPETSFAVEPGDTLVAITDGVTDTVGKDGERFGMHRLEAVLAESHQESPQVIRDRLVGALEKFQVGAQADDTALVIMRFTGNADAMQESERRTENDLLNTGTGGR